jgi:phosphatidate cytidylyltransferase
MVIKLDRIIPGIFLLFSIIFFYFSNFDYFFFTLISFLILFDLYKSNLIKSFILLLISFSLVICIEFLFSEFLYIIVISSILISLKIKKHYKEIFLIIILFYILIIYDYLFYNRELFFFIIFLSFFNDTCAFLFGNIIKGPLITPSISPNKTWSGTVFSFLITLLLLTYFNFNLILSFFLSISFFIGDLYFSFIKRKLNIKDYSNIFSGHGGILDRLDSMFLSFIIYNLYLNLWI